MSIVSVEAAREHLNVDETSQDGVIQDCIDAAEAHAAQFMGRPLEPWAVSDGEEEDVPRDVERAVLLLVGSFFHDRENPERNMAAERLMHPHRKGLGV